jgi:hypothetical protein
VQETVDSQNQYDKRLGTAFNSSVLHPTRWALSQGDFPSWPPVDECENKTGGGDQLDFVEKQLDKLIEAGWFVLDSDFDPEAFADWRRSALVCVAALAEPGLKRIPHFDSVKK